MVRLIIRSGLNSFKGDLIKRHERIKKENIEYY